MRLSIIKEVLDISQVFGFFSSTVPEELSASHAQPILAVGPRRSSRIGAGIKIASLVIRNLRFGLFDENVITYNYNKIF